MEKLGCEWLTTNSKMVKEQSDMYERNKIFVSYILTFEWNPPASRIQAWSLQNCSILFYAMLQDVSLPFH